MRVKGKTICRREAEEVHMKVEKGIAALVLLSLLACVSAPSGAFAVSYHPPFRLVQSKNGTVVKGGIVYIFHSGTADVRGTIHSNDVLTVYRTSQKCTLEVVGKVRVIAFVGETYMEAEVIEGELKMADIAKKGDVSGLVVATEPCAQ
jgi:hypothetical protein